MPDDKSKVGEPDRSPVAADEDHEVSHLAETLSIGSDEAPTLIEIALRVSLLRGLL